VSAPTIQLPATTGSFDSRQAVSQGPLVVAFYPMAFTGG
jgi:peroxiredoxin